MRLNDKTILITGGTSGIGAVMAKRFTAMGNNVIVCARDMRKLMQTAADLGVRHFQCDVSDLASCKDMLADIELEFGHIDLLIHCAGILLEYDLASTDDSIKKIRDEIEINAIAPVTLTSLALPLLKKSTEPAVVFVSSGLAYAPFAPTPVYTGTKSLIHHVAQNLRHQFEPLGIRVFELLPPLTDTPMAEGMNSPAFKKASPDSVVDALVEAMSADRFEVPVGQARQLRLMSRLAPNFLFKRMATALDQR